MRVRQHYDDQLQALHNEVVGLGQQVVAAITQALEALATNNVELAREVRAADLRINQAQQTLDSHAFLLIATQQPVARDLRSILAAIAVGSELERIGDYAKGIAQFVIGPNGPATLQPPPELLELGALAVETLRQALAALDALDVTLAQAIGAKEEQVDQLYDKVIAVIGDSLALHKENAARAADLLFIAHNLERIADRATNIAERVIFHASGETVQLNP